MRYWRVYIRRGKVDRVEPISVPDPEYLIVEAPNEQTAKRLGLNLYCARKKRARVEQLDRENRCACGRARDLVDEHGAPRKKCAVCVARMNGYRANGKRRTELRELGLPVPPRDEAARIEKNLERQRDRRGELRLETLLEVKRQWIEAPNVGRFGAWLEAEIEKLTQPAQAA